MSNLAKNTAIYAIGDIAPRLLSFISFPILTTYLTPSEYGIINYVNTIGVFLTVIGFLCVNTYYLVYYYKLPTNELQQKLLGNLTIFIIFYNIILSFLLFLFGPYLMKLFGGEINFYPYIAIGIITNFFNLFSILPLALFRVQEKPLSVTIINIIRGICSFALTIILVVIYNFKVLGVLYANMLIAIVFASIYLYITYKNSIWHYDWSQIKVILKFSLPLLPGSLSYYFVSMSDRILINKYVDLNSLGIYSTAATLALLLNIISYGGYKAFEPYIFKIYGTIDFKNKFITVYKNFLFILLMGAFALSLFAKEFFQLFSDIKYHEAYLYVPLIIIGVFVSSIAMLYGTVITAQGKTIINSLISIIGGTVSIILNILLLPYIGLIAACLTSAVSMSTMLVISIYFSNLKISFNETFLSILGVSIILYLSVYKFIIDDIVISIIVKFIIYILMLFSIKMLLKIGIINIFKRND
ncbi:hypothetical protein EZS27_022965 [termite gut metagenome]|uniref:Uncharacterized protein n=1 Tax=termite gut metagenome TaxID=433724 RepID=A0A5J4R2G6_9ZZZZ